MRLIVELTIPEHTPAVGRVFTTPPGEDRTAG
jgi:hypothetical protein